MPSILSPNRIRSESKKYHRICLVQAFFDFCSQGHLSQAVNSLQLLARKGIRLDSRSLSSLLRSCGVLESLQHTKWVHLFLKLTGLKHQKSFLYNHLLYAYFHCGSFNEARRLFDRMHVKNVFTWNAMLSGYAKVGMVKEANSLFDKMPERDIVSWNTMLIGFAQNAMLVQAIKFYTHLRQSSVGYNQFTFAGMLIACVKMEDVVLISQGHGQVLVSGFLSNLVLGSSIVDGYAKCGWIGHAHALFDEMQFRDVMSWTTLVSGYAKLGDLSSAHRLFDLMPEKNAISWTALIAGYAEHGMGSKALELFAVMMKKGYKPDQFTYSSSLCACGSVTSVKLGKQIHAHMIRTLFTPNVVVLSTLLDMYSKCGDLGSSKLVFHVTTRKQDIVLWNTMISALSHHGLGEEAIQLFEEMLRVGLKPNEITFVVVLTACSHSGLVDEGIQIFESIKTHGFIPNLEHYSCLIDLLGRAGQFNEVMDWLHRMPQEPDWQVWNALLGACKIQGNIELGKKAAEKLLEIKPQSPIAYMALSNIYAKLGQWSNVERVRKLMNERLVKKVPGVSWIEVEDKVYSFSMEDRFHPLKEEIYEILELLADQIELDAHIRDE
ncbi:pentatricopeptide repeat-containing protein At2g21090 [Aristolochia californica]|uniref:pentatricopeptide repeat-containing protein At2g21090 n=1 Tax=Aristolochia californica TaxID=171875 RepID=UPI0035D70BB8